MKKIGNPVFHSGKEFAQFWWCGELEGEGGGGVSPWVRPQGC